MSYTIVVLIITLLASLSELTTIPDTATESITFKFMVNFTGNNTPIISESTTERSTIELSTTESSKTERSTTEPSTTERSTTSSSTTSLPTTVLPGGNVTNVTTEEESIMTTIEEMVEEHVLRTLESIVEDAYIESFLKQVVYVKCESDVCKTSCFAECGVHLNESYTDTVMLAALVNGITIAGVDYINFKTLSIVKKAEMAEMAEMTENSGTCKDDLALIIIIGCLSAIIVILIFVALVYIITHWNQRVNSENSGTSKTEDESSGLGSWLSINKRNGKIGDNKNTNEKEDTDAPQTSGEEKPSNTIKDANDVEKGAEQIELV